MRTWDRGFSGSLIEREPRRSRRSEMTTATGNPDTLLNPSSTASAKIFSRTFRTADLVNAVEYDEGLPCLNHLAQICASSCRRLEHRMIKDVAQ